MDKPEDQSATPDISVIMTVVDGGMTLERSLQALAAQTGGLAIEVIVPFDQASREVQALAPRFPGLRFLDLGEILGGLRPRNAFEIHGFYDRRRCEALKVARAPLVGILEDRGIARADWAETMVRLHRANPHAVIGGAVTNGVDRIRNWAIFFCDFGRYQPPLRQIDPEYVTDTNICYKREALMSVRDLWEERYQEPQVNWALRRAGRGLMLTDEAITEQHRPPIGLGALAAERFHWGRLYGQIRGREISPGQRLKLLAGMPLLPFLLLARGFARQRAKGTHIKEFVLALPTMLFLLSCWAAGECAGTLESRAPTAK